MDNSTLEEILLAGELEAPTGIEIVISGSDEYLETSHRIGDVAASTIALAGAAAAHIHRLRSGVTQRVRVDVERASQAIVGYKSLALDGTPITIGMPSTMDLFECRDDRWIFLAGELPALHDKLLDLLGCSDDKEAIAAAVRKWDAYELEDTIAERRTCGAVARTREEWDSHPQGKALSQMGTVDIIRLDDSSPPAPLAAGERPLSGIRVLDLTRLLAGPVCGRTLAEHGADVLQATSPTIANVPEAQIESGHGKRTCFLDLNQATDLQMFRDLIADADIFIENGRAGNLARRGLGPHDLATLCPGLIYVSIDCYGHEGPWADRGGVEFLAQMVSGLALEEGRSGIPQVLPGATNDYLTGYLAAYGAMLALGRRISEGGSWWVRASLCQTAQWIQALGAQRAPAARALDLSKHVTVTQTPHGLLTHMLPVVELSETPARWDLPSAPVGHHSPVWL